MPKNLSTLGGATKLRFGKNCREDQAENSIVFNASEKKIDATQSSGVYITPLELSTDFSGQGSADTTNTFVVYNQETHKLLRTNVPLSLTGISSASGSGVSGDVTITGDLFVEGNVTSIGTVANIHVTNTTIKDGLVELGTNNTDLATFDLGHIYNRGPSGSNVAMYYDASETKLVIAYTTNSAMEVTQIVPEASETESMNVHVHGKLFTNSNVGVANTNPIHTLSISDKVFIDSGNHANVIEARGDTHTTGNVYIDGGIIMNAGGVNKKTYSHATTIPQNTSVSDATITLTFTKHPFYAKIVAQIIDDVDTEVSTMILDVAGGERGGDYSGGTPIPNIAQGPLSVFGTPNTTNPWSSTVTTDSQNVTLKPSTTFGLTHDGKYTIFIEYIPHETGGRLESITQSAGTSATFTY